MAFDPVKGLVPGRFNRRQLIVGSGSAAMLAAALAACGSDSDNSTAPADSGAAPATDAATTATDAATTGTDAATTATDAAAAPAGTPKPGGILRVGTKGDVNDIIDGQHIVAKSDIMRQVTGWEPLMSFDKDFKPTYDNALAKDVTAKAADDFVVTLKDDIKFSNGNPVTADGRFHGGHDHTHDHACGGSTCHDNLGLFCRHHHRAKHEAGWTVIQTSPGRFEWRSPSGHIYRC